jgi:hypothetical protein
METYLLYSLASRLRILRLRHPYAVPVYLSVRSYVRLSVCRTGPNELTDFTYYTSAVTFVS